MRERLYNLLDSTKGGPVLVIGDIILDCYLSGSVDRISPEAPVQVFEVEGETWKLGGAANVAANVKALGWEPILVGAVGQDRDAEVLRALLAREGIDPGFIVADPNRPTIIKTRIIAMRQQMLRLDREKKISLSKAVATKMLSTVRA
ncbi:MAG: PfkB family carbohydrate kinase, partial [Nitrospinota bacterium]|nr:PfkB family carbohydrate kinase [Nitrospinota bacterium]